MLFEKQCVIDLANDEDEILSQADEDEILSQADEDEVLDPKKAKVIIDFSQTGGTKNTRIMRI